VVKDINLIVTVSKINPVYELPTSVVTEYGKTLADVKLPAGFSFQDVLTTPVGNIGKNTFKVTYTPTDTVNYNVVKDIDLIVTVVDTTAPVITLNGEKEVTIDMGTTYLDQGVIVTDNYDRDITNKLVTINPVDVNKDGTYIITYNVTDINGNKAVEVTRKVIVIDTTKPTITLTGVNPQVIEVHGIYTELGATAVDNKGNKLDAIVIDITNIKLDVVGTYKVIYTVSDKDGLTRIVERIVNVVDTTKPTIKLNGNKEINVELGSTYLDAGAVVTDNYDKDTNITGKHNIDTKVVGTYTVTYNAKDTNNNKADEVTRIVHVIDTIGPEMNFEGAAEIDITVGDTYTDKGFTATDPSGIKSQKIVSDYVNTNLVGIYRVVYEAVDNYGNVSTLTRIVYVNDKLPIIYASMYNNTKSERLTSTTYNAFIQLLWEKNSAKIKLSKDGGELKDAIVGELLKDGKYVLQVSSRNNKVEYNFTIDTICPVITGVEALGKYEVGTTFTWDEGIVALTCNGISEEIDSTTKSYTLVKEGKYLLSITDAVGNKNEIFFTVTPKI
ncbi:MAG: DUF5011 domain-containing protein, partial [Clostridia bacterium]